MKNNNSNKAFKFISTVLLFLIISGKSICQDVKEYSIYNYSVDDGMSQSTVFSMFHDSKGFIWIGTRGGGLNRFDGYDFKVYKSNYNDPKSISGNEVIAIYEDKRGFIWIGNRTTGLDRLDRTKDNFKHYRFSVSPVESFSVNHFLEDKNNRLWMASSAGLFYYEADTDSFIHCSGFPSINVSSICLGNENQLIVASQEGVYSFDPQNKAIEYKVPLFFEKLDKGRQWNLPLLVDSKSNIWFGTINGFNLVSDFKKGTFIKNPFKIPLLDNVHVRSIIEDKNGYLWVGCINGIVKIDPNTGTWQIFQHNDNDAESICHSSIHTILEDAQGNIWLGTWGGICMLSHLPKKFRHVRHIPYSNSLSNNIVSAFEETKQGIWIGTEGGGLNFLDKKTNQFEFFGKEQSNGILTNHIKCLQKDNNDNLWVGTWGKGIYKLVQGANKFQNFLEDQSVFCMEKDAKGFLWIGTLNGLYKYNVENGKYNFYSPENTSGLNDYFITSLFCDSRGNLWAGTKEGGLHLYNVQKDNFISFIHDNKGLSGLIDNYIICINQDKKDNLWIGTNNGVCRYNYALGNFEDYSEKINLPDNVINGIVPDNFGNLWISTNNGLSKYNEETNEIRNYDIRDGLQSNEFNRGAFLKSSKGEIFFGGINGYSAFYPDKVVENKIEPEIIFTDFKLFNNSAIPNEKNSPLKNHISETTDITLNYKQSFFTFEFVALNFLLPEKNLYKYKLEGYNNDWVELGHERKVSFMNLPDGNYNLKIIASNNDEVWNMEGISVKITVLPAPWKTGWAYVIYLVIIGLLIWFWQQLISSRIKQKNEIMNERREKERNEELNQLKLYFFTNITHEFRTPLTLISAPLDNLILDDVPKDKKEFYYRLIKENIRRLKRLVDQLMDFRKAENERLMLKIRHLDLKEFINRMADNFTELARNKNISFKVDFRGQGNTFCWFDPEILDKIIYNLLSNAFKFTPAGGSITIKVNINPNKAEIAVSDSGIGISSEDLPHVFERFYTSAKAVNKYYSGTGIGLSFSKRLAEIHHGSLGVESEQEKGSIFTLNFPVLKEDYSANEVFEEIKGLEWEENHEPVFAETEEEDLHFNEDEIDDKNILLVVEDNLDLSAYLKTQFSGLFKVYSARNGKEGFQLAREKMPDIIISDVMMDEMDGYEFCDKIKNDILTNHIPLILLTALSSIENKMDGMDLGADAYIEKPFEIKYLESVVQNLLKQRTLLREKYFIENHSISKTGETNLETKFLSKFEEIVYRHLSDPDFSVTVLCRELNLSRSQLFRKFRSITGNNPSDFIRIMRLKKAAEIILKEGIGINEVAYEVGFTSPSHFISSFKKYYGKTPGEYSGFNRKEI